MPTVRTGESVKYVYPVLYYWGFFGGCVWITYFILFYEIGCHYVAQIGLEVRSNCLSLSECWNCSCALPWQQTLTTYILVF